MFKFPMYDSANPLSSLTAKQRKQYEHIRVLREYYEGNMVQHLKSDINKDGAMIDDNVTLNLARRIVDKGNNFLFGKGLNWQLDDFNQTEQENALYNIWGNEETKNAFLTEVGISGAINGNFYIQILQREEVIKLKILDPLNTFVIPNSEFDNEVALYDLRWSEGKDFYRILNYSENGKAWLYRTEKWEARKWITIVDEQQWAFPWAFVLSGKNLPKPHSVYGLSDLEDIEINDEINRVASNLNKIVRIFAHPVIWGTGWSSSDFDTSTIINSSNPHAKLQALELARDLGDTQEFLRMLKQVLAEVTSIPESDPDRLTIGAQSGFALQVLFNDAVLKTGTKRNFYGKELIELNRRLLELAGYGDKNITKLYWSNPLPLDERTENETDRFLIENKIVSKKTIATKRGYDYDIESQRIAEESRSPLNLVNFDVNL